MIRFTNVTKTYPKSARPALDEVSINIESGEFVFIVGPSGSGKSTLLRIALREERATSGSVLVSGQDVGKLSMRKVPRMRRQMGAVFQDFRLLPGKTVYQNVAFALHVIGKSRSHIRSAVPETLEMVGLAGKEKRLPHQLSGGEQQRVAIARAVVNKPEILLCDEPTGNLDPKISLDIVHLLDRINRSGTTVVMATHDDEIVNDMLRRVVQLDDGKVVRDEEHATYHPTAEPEPGTVTRREDFAEDEFDGEDIEAPGEISTESPASPDSADSPESPDGVESAEPPDGPGDPERPDRAEGAR